jgi:hypothetical protein
MTSRSNMWPPINSLPARRDRIYANRVTPASLAGMFNAAVHCQVRRVNRTSTFERHRYRHVVAPQSWLALWGSTSSWIAALRYGQTNNWVGKGRDEG